MRWRIVDRAVEGHFDHPHGRDWMHIADHVHPYFAEIVGKFALFS